MSDDWFREQSRLEQHRQDQQYQDQVFRTQLNDSWRIENERIEQGIVDRHEEQRLDWEAETRKRRQGELEQLVEGIQPAPHGAHSSWSRHTAGGPGRTEQFSWGKLLAAGIVAGALWLANRHEQQSGRPPGSGL